MLEYTQEGIYVLINNGDLTFDSLLLCSTKGYSAICNLDLNPPEDIMVFGPNTDELIFFQNLGNSMFLERNTLPLIDALAPNAISDFNNDGYDDLCYSICWWTGYTDSIYIRMNDQNWSLDNPHQYYVGPMVMFRTEIADLNGDNFKDIIMYGYSPRNAFKILWNDGFGGFGYENPVGVGEHDKAESNLKIYLNPNPFTSILHITINAANQCQIKVFIVDQFARSIKDLYRVTLNCAKDVELTWDGKDDSGMELAKGAYFLIITENERISHIVKIIN